MKNIILQHWSGELGELEERSRDNIMEYAKFCGADYELLRGNVFRKNLAPQCQKCIMLDSQFDEYDTVVMVDIDMFTRVGNTKNIFTDDTGFGRHFGIQTALRKNLCRSIPHLGSLIAPFWGGSIYRGEREMRQRLREGMVESEMQRFSDSSYVDEGIMHRLAMKAGMRHDDPNMYLDEDKWNKSSFEDDVSDGYIIHIRNKIKNTPGRPSPKQDKMLNYHALVKRGIVE